MTDLEELILERVHRSLDFLRNHRYDPTEYYGEQDYLKEIPDPCSEPLAVLEEFLEILQTFGIKLYVILALKKVFFISK